MNLKIKPCPQCKRVPLIGYVCGEYFITSTPATCFCSSFTEMHASKEQEIEAWNREVSKYE